MLAKEGNLPLQKHKRDIGRYSLPTLRSRGLATPTATRLQAMSSHQLQRGFY